MTDNEIIKALPKILYGGHGCIKCEYAVKKGDDRCGLKGCRIARDALDLINRQQVEIETWKEAFNNLDKIARPSIEYVENVKAEAIREFAERLKLCAESTREYSQWLFTISEDQIDNLIAEISRKENDNA